MTQPSETPVCARLTPEEGAILLAEIVAILDRAPFFTPTMPRWGTPFSVRMSNCGPLGWVSDKSGYRYQARHPVTGLPWPPMPARLLDLWRRLADCPAPPEACLINHYGPKARMGLHQDRDEKDFSAPVLSISLGDSARFRLGGPHRQDPSAAFDLVSGDVMRLSGQTRLAFHGIDKVMPGTSTLLSAWPDLFPQGGRLNLTLRRVNPV